MTGGEHARVSPQVKFKMSDDTTLADLLQLNLHKYEDEVRNIVDKAVKESGMEKVPRPRAPRGSSGATRSRHAAARASRYTRVFSSPPVTGTSEFTTKKKKRPPGPWRGPASLPTAVRACQSHAPRLPGAPGPWGPPRGGREEDAGGPVCGSDLSALPAERSHLHVLASFFFSFVCLTVLFAQRNAHPYSMQLDGLWRIVTATR